GDEVRDPGQPLPQGAIYDANRFTLAALLAGHGFAVSDLGILPDRREQLLAAISRAAEGHDALISSGGVSTGEEDHVKAAIAALGRLDLWRLAIKPGRPVALGMAGGKPYIGLPGNPAAAFLTYLRFARPILFRLAGADGEEPHAFAVRAGFDYRKKTGRLEWVRVRLAADGAGGWIARKHPREGAGLLTSIVMTDGIVELEEDRTEVAEGEYVRFLPYAAFMA
ncbi:MAG: molybdopterin molybdotransferase MoeA, partial [Alphaproteobacteria bacterium]|nr:molybdopterin molybdotransferase MoeA [Alphaproteobacteria bacterium]